MNELQGLLGTILGVGPTQATGGSAQAATNASVEFLGADSDEVKARAYVNDDLINGSGRCLDSSLKISYWVG